MWGLFFFFSGFGLSPLIPLKGNFIASACQDILDNAMLQMVWTQFGEGPYLFQHDCAPVHKAKTCLEFGVEEPDSPTEP